MKRHPWSVTPKKLDIQFPLKLCNTVALKGMYLRMTDGTKGRKSLIGERDIKTIRVGEEACTEISVTSGRAKGLTRTCQD